MSTTNGTRGGSKSPTDGKGKQSGGVALPFNGLHDNERQASVTSPYKADAHSAVKLSAGASPFKPGVAKNGPLPIHLLNKNSVADVEEATPTIVTSPTPKQANGVAKASTQQPIGTRSSSDLSPVTATVYFTTDMGPIEFQGGHYIKIDNLSKSDLHKWEEIMSDCDIEQLLRGMKIVASADDSRFTYLCCFDDIRGTSEAERYIEAAQLNNWVVTYISQTEYAGAPDGGASLEKSSYHDGQVIFVASFNGPTADFKVDGADKTVHHLAESFGELRAFTHLTSAAWPNLEFRVEYYSIAAAKRAIAKATKESPQTVGNWKVVAKELPDHTIQASTTGANNDAVITNGMAGIKIVGTPPLNDDGKKMGEFASPTGRTSWRYDENGNHVPCQPLRILPKVGSVPFGVPILQAVQQGTARHFSEPTPFTPGNYVHSGPRNNSWAGSGNVNHQYNNNNGANHYKSGISFSRGSPSHSIPGPQAVEIWKIENGQDVRTTVMLRNIPNKMTCHDLKKVLDLHCYGRYDFSYLRIDFEKGTNVGYAFVNFSDPMNILPFVENHAGQRWQADNVRKVELSYATVQGFDCLVEKFRNSAIMSEFTDFRPKLWHSWLAAPKEDLVGKEMQFPGPNNPSKKQRSMDNAGQIGLYAPRSNHVNRERGRYSQYDRGTPSQVEHDAKYYDATPPMTNGHYSHGSYNNSGSYGRYGYNTPRVNMMAPPPQFPIYYNNGYPNNGYPYVDQNGYANQQTYGFGAYDNGDVFGGPGYNNGGYVNGYPAAMYQQGNGHGAYNGYPGGAIPFGTGPNTPASRLRTQTNGKLGGRPKNVTVYNGSYQNGGHDDNGYSPEYAGPLPQVVEAPEDEGYNDQPGPFYCPRY